MGRELQLEINIDYLSPEFDKENFSECKISK